MTHDQIKTKSPKNHGHLIHWAANYDRLLSIVSLGMERRIRRRIIEKAEISPLQRVLDVGCGTGTLAIEAAKTVGPKGRVEGIDPSPEMNERARTKTASSGQSVHFQEAGIEALPFPNDSFDTVLSSLMFHHLDEEQQLSGLAEIHRVLAPGGRLTIVDFSEGGPILHRLASRFAHHGTNDHSRSGDPLDKLVLEATKVGFCDVQSRPFKPRFLYFLSARVSEKPDPQA